MAKGKNNQKIKDLFELITKIKDIKDCENFFDDLCTKKEIQKMADRVYAAKLLMAGKTYNEVIAETDISSATLSRISQCVQYGSGYKRLLEEYVDKTYQKKKESYFEEQDQTSQEEEIIETEPNNTRKRPNFIEWD